MKQLSAKIIKQLETIEARFAWYVTCAEKAINPTESTAEWLKSRSPDYYRGLLAGQELALEDILHANKAYAGYRELPSGIRSYIYLPAKV